MCDYRKSDNLKMRLSEFYVAIMDRQHARSSSCPCSLSFSRSRWLRLVIQPIRSWANMSITSSSRWQVNSPTGKEDRILPSSARPFMRTRL